MLIVSHHLLKKTDIHFHEKVTMRINVAWIKNLEELIELIEKISHDIYLDYPQGRTKPPKPKIHINEVLKLPWKYDHIKHFAVSNVEDPEKIYAIRKKLPKNVQLIPKIETRKGVRNLEKIIKKIKTKYIMLDKEDLYVDVDNDIEQFEKLVDLAREKCKKCGVKPLELRGVVFTI